MEPKNAVLSIAGSDPSGGAGIQADLKTCTAIGVYGAAAITCLTAQNTTGVKAVQPVEPDFVKKQVEMVLEDLPISHIKTGMIGTSGVARILGELFAKFPGEIICDPVLIASDGQPLLEKHGLEDFQNHVAAHATVLTPNIPELITLSGHEIKKIVDIEPAVISLFSRFSKLRLVLVTGGHLPGQSNSITDFLFKKNEPAFTLNHMRHQTNNTHGTGCTFAAAYAAYHLLTNSDYTAFQSTVIFMDKMLEMSAKVTMGQGCGPLQHHLKIY